LRVGRKGEEKERWWLRAAAKQRRKLRFQLLL